MQPKALIVGSCVVAVVVVLVPAAIGVQSPTFTDIPSEAWYEDSVKAGVSRGWFKGYADRTFRPDAAVSRAELATILERLDKQYSTLYQIICVNPGIANVEQIADAYQARYRAELIAACNRQIGSCYYYFDPQNPDNQSGAVIYCP